MAKQRSNGKIIEVRGARKNNLQNIDITFPRNKLIVFTGVSGSGKSSLVFDTIYAEGQRRYVESLSAYARQFLERIDKPDVDLITGISPAVAIEQKTGSRNSRSTVGTTTEIYDYLRLLFARVGKTICFICEKEVKKASTGTVVDWLEQQEKGKRFYLGFPLFDHEGRSMADEVDLIKKRGFFRIYYKGELVDLNETDTLPKKKEGVRVVVQRFKASPGTMREKLADSIETTFREGENRVVIIDADTNEEIEFNKFYECCGVRYAEPEPRFFSFNNPFGACPVCQGFGRVYGYDIESVVPDQNLSIVDGAIVPWRTQKFSKHLRDLIKVAKPNNIPINIPFKKLTDEQIDFIKKGTKGFIGIDRFFEKLEEKTYKMHIRVYLSKYRGYTTCRACKGSRLRREAMQVKLNNQSIWDVVRLPIEKALGFLDELQLTDFEREIGERILKELRKRLTFLNDVGLGYLTLDRLSHTLSGGETQRINLATALGSSLVGTLYVLDEPSIGLHPRDNSKLINILKNLRDIGNTVLVVEHDQEMMEEADLLVDMGPHAGRNGGKIIFNGTPKEILKDKNSLTGKYLSGKIQIPMPKKRKTIKTPSITVTGATEHNLKGIDVEFPLKKMVVVTGVSGSGKSTLVHDVLYGGIAKEMGLNPPSVGKCKAIKGNEHIDHIEIVDQSPIGKSPRSNPVSYIKTFEHIRELFASTHQAKVKGFKPGYFSFNVPGGRCETCQGDGFIKVEMQFLADIYLECEDCKGTRFKKEIRDITFRNKNLVEVLNMTVNEAVEFFKGVDKVLRGLEVLQEVGLGYIKLGQPSNTLSGGEAQRIKLANHLNVKKDNKHNLFIFDEPTTGLHFDDISTLLECFRMLIENNNSVIIIEHNLEVIKCADHVIDLGPEAGERGGEVIAVGTPEDILKEKNSWTGKYLKQVITN